MTDRTQYTPGPARGAQVQKDGEQWTLILVRDLRHAPEKVWQALTDPAELREWAPFDADQSLGKAGNTVQLTTVGAPTTHVTETTVTQAEAPKVLEYNWGGPGTPLGAPTARERDAPDAVAQHRPPFHLHGGCRVAHLPRCDESSA